MNTNSKEYTDQPESEQLTSCDISQYTQKMAMKVKGYFENPSSSGEWEIRRVSVPDEAVNYKDIADRMATLFPSADVAKYNLCWKDKEGDFIAFSSQEEFEDAVKSVEDGVLRIYLREIEEMEKQAIADHEEVSHSPLGRQGRKWRRHHLNKNGDGSQEAPVVPHWAPHMRRCMRRCMMHAWYMKHGNQDYSETMEKTPKKWHHFDMKPKEIPEEWRKWMRGNIQQGMKKAFEESVKPDASEDESNTNEVVNDEACQKMPFDQIPKYWRKHVRQCTKKAWEKNFEGTSSNENEDGENASDLPPPLRKFMRHNMVKAWSNATRKDEDMDEKSEGACGGEKLDKQGGAGSGRCGRKGKQGHMGHFHGKASLDGDATDGISKGMKKMKLNKGGNQHLGTHVRPYWAPHMRRCMRRCMMQAWHMKHADASQEGEDKCYKKRCRQMKPKDIPEEWRKWVHSEIQQSMKKAKDDEQDKTTGEVDEAKQTDGGACKKPFDSVPIYWRRHMRQSTRKAWSKVHEDAGSAIPEHEKDEQTPKDLPPPLRNFMRHNLVKAWEAAASEKKVNADEQTEVTANDASGNKQENQAKKQGPLHELPRQWKGAMRATMGKACRAIDHFKHVSGGETINMEVMSDLNSKGDNQDKPLKNMKPGVRQFMREAMLDAWKDFKAKDAEHKKKEKGKKQSGGIPQQWRQAMRKSMIKLWKESCKDAEPEKKKKKEVPVCWRQFMKNNMETTWRSFAEANGKCKQFGRKEPTEMKPWNAKQGKQHAHLIRIRRRLMNARARRESMNLRIFNLRQKKGKVVLGQHGQNAKSGNQDGRLVRINHRLKCMRDKRGFINMRIQNLREKLGQQRWEIPSNDKPNMKCGKHQEHKRGQGKQVTFYGPDYMTEFTRFGGRPTYNDNYCWDYEEPMFI